MILVKSQNLCQLQEVWISRTGYVVGMIIFVKEGETVEANHLVSDAPRAEKVADCFRDKEDNLQVIERIASAQACSGRLPSSVKCK